MTQIFDKLEVLAQQEIDLTLPLEVDERALQYDDAPLEEIFELLEESVESYSALAPQLPVNLRQSARQEIEFFACLFRKRFAELSHKLRSPDSTGRFYAQLFTKLRISNVAP